MTTVHQEEADIRTLEKWDTFDLVQGDRTTRRMIAHRDEEGIWLANLKEPTVVPYLHIAFNGPHRNTNVYDVSRESMPRMSIRLDVSGGDWGEVYHVPTGMIVRRAHALECFEFFAENVAIDIDQSEAVIGPRL